MKLIEMFSKFKSLLVSKSFPFSDVVEKENEISETFKVDTNAPIRWGVWVIICGFGGFLFWAAFAPLDEGVPAQGAVSIETKRKVVQHLTGGIIRGIYVKEGQFVKEGQVLITFDNVNAKARYEEIRQKYTGDRVLENRLQAEQEGKAKITFHSDIVKTKDDPLVYKHMKNQEMLLLSRRASLNADLQSFEESIQGQLAQIQGLEGVLESRRSQLRLLKDQLSGLGDLVREGYAPRSQQQDLELKVAQLNGDLADSQAGILKAKRGIAEIKQRAIGRREEYRKEVDTQMAQVRIDVDSNSEKLKALGDELNRTEVRSPVAGQVVGLQFQTLGSIVQAGQKILDVVPVNETLLLEAKISPELIDRIRVGQDADIRFASFANSPQLAVEGRVESVSKDLLTEPNINPSQPGATYYLARVSVTARGIQKLGNRVMQPGMPVQVMIKTGERSLLTYLLHPFVKRMAASLKEE